MDRNKLLLIQRLEHEQTLYLAHSEAQGPPFSTENRTSDVYELHALFEKYDKIILPVKNNISSSKLQPSGTHNNECFQSSESDKRVVQHLVPKHIINLVKLMMSVIGVWKIFMIDCFTTAIHIMSRVSKC